MKNYKNTVFYSIEHGGFTALMYWIITKGKKLEASEIIVTPESGKGSWGDFITSMQHNFQDPLAILLAQIITIILVAEFFG
jgi:hypothetical protein